MGARLGVSARYIGMIERGDKEIKPDSSIALLFETFAGGEPSSANLVREAETVYGGDLIGEELRRSRPVLFKAINERLGELGYDDPRHGTLGQRLITPDYLDGNGDYNAHRLSLGVVDSAYDFGTAQMFPADVNMDIMNGVDFKKGCFVGQEIVARMKHKTDLRKGLVQLRIDGSAAVGQ